MQASLHTPNLTPVVSRSCLTSIDTSPRQRTGRRRTQSDTYRRVALTRSASQALRIQKPMRVPRSYVLRNKSFLLELLKASASKDSGEKDSENSICRITPISQEFHTTTETIGLESIQRKPKNAMKRKSRATAIKLDLFNN